MKDLAYYMSLQYDIKVQELPEDDGGGVFLSIPLLGEMAVCAHGETYQEARAELEAVKRDYLEMWISAGLTIPEPKPEMESWIDRLSVSMRELGLLGA